MIFYDNSSSKNVLTFEVSENEIEGLRRCCADENCPFHERNV